MTSTAGFTKGPWRRSLTRGQLSGGVIVQGIAAENGVNIAWVTRAALEAEQNEALVIAAPDLYEALRDTTAEAVEHRKNIIEARTANFMGAGSDELREAYDKEIARFDGLIDRARAALSKAVKP